jgi:Sigma-70, region 4
MVALDRVQERRRAVALAHHYRDEEGLSIAEIARRLGRAEATVKAYLYDPSHANKRPTDNPQEPQFWEFASIRNRCFVEVDAVNENSWVAARDRKARAARTAREVSDPGRRIRPEALVNCGTRRQPVASQQVVEQDPARARLTLTHIRAVSGERNTGAGAESLEYRLERARAADQQLRHRVAKLRLDSFSNTSSCPAGST